MSERRSPGPLPVKRRLRLVGDGRRVPASACPRWAWHTRHATRRDKDKPFFLLYQHKAPHRNWQPGPKYLDHYKDVELPEPPTLFDDYSGRARPARENQMSIAEHLNDNDLKITPPAGLTPEQLETFTKAYAEENEFLKRARFTSEGRTKWNYQRFVKDYLRCVDAVDDNVGRVLDYLDKSGLAENTVVFYTSDQGWYLGEHGWYDKRCI